MKPPRLPTKLNIDVPTNGRRPELLDSAKTREPAPSINGPFRVVARLASAEARAKAEAISEAGLGDNDAEQMNQPQEAPDNEQDSNVSVGPKEKKVKLDDLLAGALAKVGYVRVGKLAYRAAWSTQDVEHFLTFDPYGTPKIYLQGDVCLRNKEADAFAEQCRCRYTSPVFEISLPPW
jgi:hypothetical protein